MLIYDPGLPWLLLLGLLLRAPVLPNAQAFLLGEEPKLEIFQITVPPPSPNPHSIYLPTLSMDVNDVTALLVALASITKCSNFY